MDPIITPIVGIAASQTISGIANITTIAEGLLTFWSSIKGIVENNKSINDIIDKFINKAKQKVRNRDWLDQPIFISNAEVLENVLLKANNEKLSISGVKNIDVFNDIYDEIIYDKEFWEILQDLLTEHRLQIINNREKDIHDTSTAIQQKVDEVIAQIKTIVIAIEKANLSIDKLRPYYPFDKELFIYEEENRKLYRDKALIEKIHQNLDSKHVYLIQSSEGRGKTTLCRIIASDYYSQDTKVYFVDLKSDVEIDTIRKCCIELDKTKTKTLLVLENIHASGDLEALVSMINTYKADLRFLLNARPTESDYAMYLKELGEDNIFDLRPLPEYCEGVARCLCKDKPISEGDLPSFISKKIYSKTNQQNAGANLRLLRIYCSVWNEGNYGSILDIREHDILEKFKSTYGLRTASRLEKNALLYLSCMYQFDVPLQEELLTDEDSDGLQGFYNKGLCTFFDDNKFYLPHSVDATLLCKAICGYNQYIRRTTEIAKKYINAILASSNPRKFEGDFKLLIRGLIERKDEFRILFNELADWPMAENIIKNIDPGFVIIAFNTHYHAIKDIQDFYQNENNKKWLRQSILELPPVPLILIRNFFQNYLHYSIAKDLFVDTNKLEEYLSSHPMETKIRTSFRGKFKKQIKDLGEKQFQIFETYVGAPVDTPAKHSNTLRYQVTKETVSKPYLFSYYEGKNDYCITQRTIYYYWTTDNPFDIQCLKNGFRFEQLRWYDMQRFIKIIHFNNNDNELCNKIVEKTLHVILQRPKSFSYASSKDLSLFFNNIALINNDIYERLINNNVVVIEIKNRQSSQKYNLDDLRLFTHFYRKKWFDVDMKIIVNRVIDSLNEADEKDLSTFLGNMSYMNAVFYNDLIVNETIVGIAKQRFEAFTFREDYLYLFGHFYSQDWCKTKMNELIDNADEEQQKVIKAWHDKVMKGLEKGGKTLDIGTLWDYINNKFFNKQQNN